MILAALARSTRIARRQPVRQLFVAAICRHCDFRYVTAEWNARPLVRVDLAEGVVYRVCRCGGVTGERWS